MKVSLSFIFIFASLNSFAQKVSISQTAEFILPESDLKSTHRDGFGTSLQGEVFLKGKFSATASVGWITFGKKNLSSNTSPVYTFALKTYMVPVQAGARFYPWSNGVKLSGPYIAAEAGVHVMTGKVFLNGVEDKVNPSTGFSYAMGAGYRKGRIDVGAKHQSIRSADQSIYYTALKLACRLSRSK